MHTKPVTALVGESNEISTGRRSRSGTARSSFGTHFCVTLANHSVADKRVYPTFYEISVFDYKLKMMCVIRTAGEPQSYGVHK